VRTQNIIDDYDETVGLSRRILAEHAGHEPGDPAKAADAIVSVADRESPPLRLLLGVDAFGYATQKLTAQLEEISSWKAVTTSMNFD
jgi:hypothetical protein